MIGRGRKEEDGNYRTLSPGLHLFGEGLSDFRDALIQCNETDIIKILVKFIEDLVSCTEGMLGIWTPHLSCQPVCGVNSAESCRRSSRF